MAKRKRRLAVGEEYWTCIITGDGEPFIMHVQVDGGSGQALFARKDDATRVARLPAYSQFSPRVARVRVTEVVRRKR